MNRRGRIFSQILIVVVIYSFLAITSSLVQATSPTYKDTRSLLSDMNNPTDKNALKQLFEQGEDRMSDIIVALNDSDMKVVHSAEAIIQYLADPSGLAAMDEQCIQRQKKFEPCSRAGVGIQTGDKANVILKGKNPDELVLKDTNVDLRASVTVKVIAYNRNKDKVLLEWAYVCGMLCGEGRYIVLKKEGEASRYLSITLAWES